MLKPICEINYKEYIKNTLASLVESIDSCDSIGMNICFGKLLGISLFLTGDSRVLVDSIINAYIDNPLSLKNLFISGGD